MELDEGPDLRVNKNIVSSLSSSDNLRQHYKNRKMEVYSAADWTKSLVEKLGGFTPAPELAGPVAVSVFIAIVCFSLAEESTKKALQRVFTDEKVSEVWDQIDECLKRCIMHINDDGELTNDIKRIECQLSAAITKLKNSMPRDGHMSSQALKAWVNGAAFHIQMLIHLVRLGGIQTCDPAERLLSAYLSDLDSLFREHKEVIKGRCRMEKVSSYMLISSGRFLVDEYSNQHVIDQWIISYERYFEAHYDHRYGRQKCEIQQYFRDDVD